MTIADFVRRGYAAIAGLRGSTLRIPKKQYADLLDVVEAAANRAEDGHGFCCPKRSIILPHKYCTCGQDALAAAINKLTEV